MAATGDYETRHISSDVWGTMKELRRERAKLSWEAQSTGGLCVTGFAWGHLSILAGFGNFGNPSPGAGYTRIAREGTGPEGLSKYVDIAESKGLLPVCGAIGAHMGQVWANVSEKGTLGDRIRPDFVYQPMGCHALVKGGQLCADILGLPILHIDSPRKSTDSAREYLYSQLADAIEWIEKFTGKTFDDEKFIESAVNNMHSRAMWAKTADLMKTVPAPMTFREAMSLRLPLVAYSYNSRTRDYTDALYNEINGRVQDGISGTPYEKKRLMHEGLHPLYRPDILRWPEEYGAAFVWGPFFMAFGAWRHTEDDRTIPAKTPEEQGLEINSREDALRALVEFDLPLEGGMQDFSEKRMVLHTMRMIEDWHIDGVMSHLARRCPALTGGILGRKSDFIEAGIPVGTYEASESDPKEFNEPQIREDFVAFLESLGLTKLAS
ncbi:2-hydroxyacyl-CoA dehydratase [Thermodesulfobacteriota bacterium]